MKAKIQGLLLAAAWAGMPTAQAGMFDWMGEVDSSGFYAGAAMNVTKVTGQLNRRLGGENDCGEGCTLVIREPGLITTSFLRAGWRPLDFLALDAHFAIPLDSDRIDNGSNSQHFKMDSLYAIYLKPQYTLGESFTFFGRVGLSDFTFKTRCYSTDGDSGNADEPDLSTPTGCMARDDNGAIIANDDGSTTTRKTFSEDGLAWGGGLQLRLTGATRLLFEYTNYYDEDDGRAFGIGVGVTYLFGQGGGEDDYY